MRYVLVPVFLLWGMTLAQEVDAPQPGSAGVRLRLRDRSQMELFCNRQGLLMPPGDSELFAVVESFFPGNFAEAAGMKQGDIIFKKQGVVINSMTNWEKASAIETHAGDGIEYWVRRPIRGSKVTKWQSLKIEFEAMPKAAVMQADAADREMLAAKKAARGPLVMTEIGIGENAIGIPVVSLGVRNNTEQAITAASFSIECLNGFGDPVVWPGKGNVHNGIYQTQIAAGATVRIEFTLNLHPTTHEATIWVTRVKFADDSEWSQSRDDAEKSGRLESIKGR